ncbi:hypothetical protein BH23ACT11_BH23ACT11_21810 [soil metagenome]
MSALTTENSLAEPRGGETGLVVRYPRLLNFGGLKATTHAIFGVTALAGTALLAGTEPPMLAYPVAIVASWLPDIDNPKSRLGNGLSRLKNPTANLAVRPLSWTFRITSFTLARTVGHRTLTHSLLGLALFALPVWLLLGSYPNFFYACVVGYGSHLLADALNTRGVALLWPLGGSIRLLPGGIRSGGVWELGVAVATLLIAGFAVSHVYPAIDGFL